MEEVAEAAETKSRCYSRPRFIPSTKGGGGSVLGGSNEFLAAPKLDDLQCAFSSLKGFTAAKEKKAYLHPLCI